jgi:hypothetical protein
MPRAPGKKPPSKMHPPKVRPKKVKPAAKVAALPPPAEPIPAKTSDHVAGNRVTHPLFGDGTVTAVEGDKLTINFKDGRVKQIVDYYVKRRK